MFNFYSISHFLIWFLAGRFSRMGWLLFLTLSITWELIELILPFEFAIETILNKFGDVIVNMIGFGLGIRYKLMKQNG